MRIRIYNIESDNKQYLFHLNCDKAMNDDLLRDLLYFCLAGGIVLIAVLASFQMTIARLKQKNYFLNRDRERYAETLYASKDGYFAFIYPDERIKDPRRTVRERCSRRLAVMLNLSKGVQSGFEDVLECFYKEDTKKLRKYLNLMQEENIPFEDVFILKNSERGISVFGGRINGADGNLYCDMLWFRDLSAEMLKIRELEKEKNQYKQRLHRLEDMLNNFNMPVWLRDERFDIIIANKKYADIIGVSDFSAESPSPENNTALLENISRRLAVEACQTNKTQKSCINLAVNGEAKHFEVSETPFHVDGSLDKIYTIGSLADITELDAVKRTFKIHQDAHLDVLAALGTAFAIFDLRQKLVFYNKAFLNLWNLKTDFLDATPSYGEFLDKIRDSRLIPEVADFRQYKSEEEKLFGGLIESREDLLHIPDGRTFRRIVAPHPNGLIFAYEDVSDRLAATRMINELYSVQQNILDNVREAVVVFGSDQRLKYFNRSYKKLWKADDAELQGLPNLADVIEMQRPYFNHLDNWENLKQNMLGHILNICSRFRLERNDKVQIEVVPVILSDESIMITYVII